MKSRSATSTSRSAAAPTSPASASTSIRWYALRIFSASTDRPARSCGGPGQRSHTTPRPTAAPSGSARRARGGGHTRRRRSTSGRMPSSSARCISNERATRPGAISGVGELVRAAGAGGRRDRRRGAPRASGPRAREVPGRCRRFQRVPQPEPGVARRRPASPRRTSGRGAGRRAARRTAPGCRRSATWSPDALRDRLELADPGRDQREDAVGLAEVEARQHDRIGGVAAGGGHGATVPPVPATRAAAPEPGGPQDPGMVGAWPKPDRHRATRYLHRAGLRAGATLRSCARGQARREPLADDHGRRGGDPPARR